MKREDAKPYLDRAALAALRASGMVEPNPMVGAVIVRDAEVIGIGHHRRFGDLHAEREALESCRRQGHDAAGATMLVTLEPCSHTGKQPPCTEAILQAKIAKVVYARPDPGEVSGGGAALLQEAGVETELCLDSPIATHLSDPFVKRVRTGLPWVIAKWAQSIDGKIATRTGASQWISNERSRRRVHGLRAKVDAMVTGIGTVVCDDPMLTARGVRRIRCVAKRIIVDTQMDTPLDRALVRTARQAPTILACSKDLAVAQIMVDRRQELEAAGVDIMGVPDRLNGRLDLELMLRALADRHGVSTVMLEAGPGLLGAFFAADLVDEALVYVAPMVMADDEARTAAIGHAAPQLSDARRYRLAHVKRLGEDVELRYRRVVEA